MEKLFTIIHEDADILVVHKPADLVCHPTKGDEYSSLISRARIYLSSSRRESALTLPGEQVSGLASAATNPASSIQHPITAVTPHLIHRLDRETSGLVLLAKNSTAARELGKVWETRTVQKEYLAIVHGHVMAEQGIIDAPLGKDETSPVAIKDCVRPDGSPAQTEYFVEKRFVRDVPLPNSLSNGNEFSLLRLRPHTGRKHQIRIHLAHLGHPIVGDKIYGGDSDLYLALVEGRLTAEQRARLILPNHALHAVRLQFEWRGQNWDFTTPPEPWFNQFIGEPPDS